MSLPSTSESETCCCVRVPLQAWRDTPFRDFLSHKSVEQKNLKMPSTSSCSVSLVSVQKKEYGHSKHSIYPTSFTWHHKPKQNAGLNVTTELSIEVSFCWTHASLTPSSYFLKSAANSPKKPFRDIMSLLQFPLQNTARVSLVHFFLFLFLHTTCPPSSTCAHSFILGSANLLQLILVSRLSEDTPPERV